MTLSIIEDISCGHTAACQAFIDGITPPERIGVREWADKHRRLPSKGSSEPGKWRTTRTPFLAEIMDCLDKYHPARRIVFKKSSQVGGTEVLLNWVGSFIDTQRSSMMVVQPTLDMAEKWSKQRLSPMILESPSLQAKIPPARSRDSGNTTLMKEWPGGLIAISGSNSAASLAMMPIEYLGLDEVDRYPIDIDGEGDPLKIAEARTTTYPNSKILLISSPTIESLSRINKEYEASDQRKYLVPCHHCDESFEMVWEGLIWPDKDFDKAMIHCPHCAAGIEESYKDWMLEHGKWHAYNPESKIPGFHISGLYAPPGLGKSWAELAEEYDDVKHDPTRLKVFKNTRLGLTEKDANEKIEWEDLKDRAEDYRIKSLPPGALVVTVGIDVQKDRFAFLALAWGRNARHWVVDFVEIPADPTRPESFQIITDYLNEGFTDHLGTHVKAVSAGLDSGAWQTEVLTYVRSRPFPGLFAIKGSSTRNRPIIGKPTKIDMTVSGKTKRGGVEQWQVGGDTAKHEIFARLNSDKKTETTLDQLVHFSNDLPEYFYVQLCNEIYDPNKARWIATGRNEALDVYVYAMAAGHHPRQRIHIWGDHKWAGLETKLKQGDLLGLDSNDPIDQSNPSAPPPEAPKKPARKRRTLKL